MHAEQLTTRITHNGLQGEACLLIYDEHQLTPTMLGDDVREIFDTRPAISRIYILAPFVAESELREHLHSSAVFTRMGSYFKAIGGRLCVMSFFTQAGAVLACEIPFFVGEEGRPEEEAAAPVLDDLRNGWLFDLFDKYRGRVDAPVGVHFGKSSRRHSSKFLRVSNVLMSSAACGLVAYFLLGTLRCGQPRRIFVDTSPLLAVAFALQRVAIMHNVWAMYSPVISFSSYGGLENIPPSSGRDLVIVSASTSGGLVSQLRFKEFESSYIATLFYLGPARAVVDHGTVVCDLTFIQGRLFGYPPIESYSSNDCPLCRKGYFLAELEGDQFQLETRAIKQLVVKKITQTSDARETLEELARAKLIKAQQFARRGHSTDFAVDADALLRTVSTVRQRFVRTLRRYVPMPLTYVVLVDLSEETLRELIGEASVDRCFESARIISHEALPECTQLAAGTGGALVIFGSLSNFAKARDINAQLRIKVPKGCVTYLTGITLANSAEHLGDLKMFLTYGELGRGTFTYESACTLMLPAPTNGLTSWEAELTLLQQIRDNGCTDAEIEARIEILLNENSRTDSLFWPGQNGELAIQNDFVYLTVDAGRGTISQADVLATVGNLLATVRMDNRGLCAPSQMGREPIQWHQSVYGHVVLSPASFEDYNDAVLHAAFLRTASPAELNYSSDERASERILTILRAQIHAWRSGGGDSLPEFLVSLATHRLTLKSDHTRAIVQAAHAAGLPRHLIAIAEAILPTR